MATLPPPFSLKNAIYVLKPHFFSGQGMRDIASREQMRRRQGLRFKTIPMRVVDDQP